MSPRSGRIVWSQDGFFSDKQGGCQALPNGNVLIVESRTGRALEVTRTGEVVWEFYNKEEEDGLRPTLRQMDRIGGERAVRLRKRVAP
jgi:arylsulfotransferase ASST